MSDKEKRKRKKQVYQDIIRQTEFYFSPANLSKDRFLAHCLEENKDGIELTVLLTFNKLKALCQDSNVLVKALKLSDKLQLSSDNTRVKCKKPVTPKENVDQCTIYVEHLPPHADMNWLNTVFSAYGAIDYISVPKFGDGKIKGFAFVEFSSPITANTVIEEFKSSGCYLSTNMAPSSLRSITTYEPKPEHNRVITFDEQADSSHLDSDHREMEQKKRKAFDHDESFDSDKMNKKLRTEEFNENQKVKESSSEVSDSNPTEEVSKDDSNKNSTKAKKRRKKKTKKDKAKPINCGVQILSKQDWKKLRNMYLNMQREKMKSLKKQLYSKSFVHSKCNDSSTKDQEFVDRKSEVIEAPSTVVKMSLTEPVIDIKEFKKDLKKESDATYVDVKEGSIDVYIRFNSADQAKEFSENSSRGKLSVLSGKEEYDYWIKINVNRNQKRIKTEKGKDTNENEETESSCKDKFVKGEARISVVPNTIVKVNLSEPVVDVKQFKDDLKSAHPDIAYVDLQEGCSLTYIRFRNPSSVNEFLNKCNFSSAELLCGQEEQEYFHKITSDRESKFEKKLYSKVKGKQKIIIKTENIIRSHIITSE